MTFSQRVDQAIRNCSQMSFDQLKFHAFRNFNIVYEYYKDIYSSPYYTARESLRLYMIFFAILDGDLDEDEARIIEYVDESLDYDEIFEIASNISASSIYSSYCELVQVLPDYEMTALVELCTAIMFSDGGLTRGEYDFIKGHV